MNQAATQANAADTERNKRHQAHQRLKAMLAQNPLSEGTRSARRINEALRPTRPNTAPSVTATDPYLLSPSIPVLRAMGSRHEQAWREPVPFNPQALQMARKKALDLQAYRNAEAHAAVASELAARIFTAKRPNLTTRLQRFAQRHFAKGQRLAILAVSAAYGSAALYLAVFYFQHRAGA